MKRKEALELLKEPLYSKNELEYDIEYIRKIEN